MRFLLGVVHGRQGAKAAKGAEGWPAGRQMRP